MPDSGSIFEAGLISELLTKAGAKETVTGDFLCWRRWDYVAEKRNWDRKTSSGS